MATCRRLVGRRMALDMGPCRAAGSYGHCAGGVQTRQRSQTTPGEVPNTRSAVLPRIGRLLFDEASPGGPTNMPLAAGTPPAPQVPWAQRASIVVRAGGKRKLHKGGPSFGGHLRAASVPRPAAHMHSSRSLPCDRRHPFESYGPLATSIRYVPSSMATERGGFVARTCLQGRQVACGQHTTYALAGLLDRFTPLLLWQGPRPQQLPQSIFSSDAPAVAQPPVPEFVFNGVCVWSSGSGSGGGTGARGPGLRLRDWPHGGTHLAECPHTAMQGGKTCAWSWWAHRQRARGHDRTNAGVHTALFRRDRLSKSFLLSGV